MPVGYSKTSRIINGTAEDASALLAQLRELGYDVEFGAEGGASPADLEIELERCPAEQALHHAARMAAAVGSDVFVAPGALARDASPLAAARDLPSDGSSNQESDHRQQFQSAKPLEALELEQSLDRPAVQSPAAAQQSVDTAHVEIAARPAPPQAEAPAAEVQAVEAYVPYGSVFGGLDAAAAAPSATEPIAIRECSVPQVQPPVDSRPRATMEWFADAAAGVGEGIRRSFSSIAAGIRGRSAERQARRAQRREIRAAQAEQRRAARSRQAARKVIPAPQPLRFSAVAAGNVTPSQAPVVVPGRPSMQARRAGNAPFKVVAIAAGAAVCVMVAWLLFSDQDSPLPPANSSIEQQLPFGPVRVTPRAAQPSPAAPPATIAHDSSAPVPAPTPQIAKPRAATPPAQPAHARAHNSARPHRRASRSQTDSSDDVIVRHFDGQKPAQSGVAVSRNNPKHISDIQ